jgi:hypothetical protein
LPGHPRQGACQRLLVVAGTSLEYLTTFRIGHPPIPREVAMMKEAIAHSTYPEEEPIEPRWNEEDDEELEEPVQLDEDDDDLDGEPVR